MTIIGYTNAFNVKIRFDSGYITKTSYTHFKEGSVKDLFEPTVCGVGFVGGKTYSKSKDRVAYNTWMHMIWRCYGHTDRAYENCKVCEEWRNFQTYAKWYYDNYYEIPGEKMNVDKDILSKGSKIYSPDTCCFIPNCLNSMIITQIRKQKPSKYYGVAFDKRDRTSPYGANYYLENGNKTKKMFRTEEEAFVFFADSKEKRIKDKAESLKSYLPTKVYDAIMAFSYKKAVVV